MVDNEKKECGNCKEEFWPRELKHYKPLNIWICPECYRTLSLRELAARERCFQAIREL